jgi:hypothetical protein
MLGKNSATVKKQFYRSFELIYSKKFNPNDYQKPEIKAEYLKRECSTCLEYSTCKDLCPDVLSYADQDTKPYLRERLGDQPI